MTESLGTLVTQDFGTDVGSIIGEYIDSGDVAFGMHFMDRGFEGDELRLISSLHTAGRYCLDSDTLTGMLRAQGYNASTLYNPSAYTEHLEVSEDGIFAEFSGRVTHAITELVTERTRIYIDPHWQYFVLRQAGVEFADVFRNQDVAIMPGERVLTYQRGDMNLVAELYATTSRILQDKIRRGVLRSKVESYVRNIDIAGRALGIATGPLPVGFNSCADLEDIAYGIWSPQNYYKPSQAELDSMRKKQGPYTD
ncbi:hypothetical protein KBD20_03175 [Candidatus Saccharibacteria bacterium]|nr:hypothetical protein [Candidatus Saccharibacteria bacterium]